MNGKDGHFIGSIQQQETIHKGHDLMLSTLQQTSSSRQCRAPVVRVKVKFGLLEFVDAFQTAPPTPQSHLSNSALVPSKNLLFTLIQIDLLINFHLVFPFASQLQFRSLDVTVSAQNKRLFYFSVKLSLDPAIFMIAYLKMQKLRSYRRTNFKFKCQCFVLIV